MLKNLAIAVGAVALVAACLVAPIAYAVADTVAAPAPSAPHVVIPWGQWLSAIIGQITVPGVVAWVGWVGTHIGVPWVKDLMINAAVQRAVGSGLATVAGAVSTQANDVVITNEVARSALTYLVTHEPQIVNWLGDAIGPRILAELGKMGLAPAEALSSPTA